MKLFCTSKNSGPTWSGLDPITLLYLGPSEEKAIEVVGDFVKYEREAPSWGYRMTALPQDLEVKYDHYYMADGWWRTVVSFEIEDSIENRIY